MILAPRTRPAFDAWRYARGLTLRATAALINDTARQLGEPVTVSHEKVRTLCLPLDHADRTAPSAALLRVIEKLTACAVSDFPPVRTAA